ncbi:MAG: nucleotide pyrophosphohydrolase [Anaerolineales bacterium]|nr:nucleotide pyrophosphohydrolase [Anaerolineales bacterium]
MSSDNDTSIADLRRLVAKFIADRSWESYHSPKNLVMSIAIEAAELMEHFQWMSAQESINYLDNPESKAAVADELADVVIYCLSLANRSGIDLTKAVIKKVQRNQDRFPA